MEEHIKSVLLILGRSGFATVEVFIQLACTCKRLYTAVITDEKTNYYRTGNGDDENSLWAALNRSIYTLEQYGFSPEILQEVGYLWAFQQFIPTTREGPSSTPSRHDVLGPPTLAYDDFCIMVSLKYQDAHGKSALSLFCLKGKEQLKPLMSEGVTLLDVDPIVVSGAKLTGTRHGLPPKYRGKQAGVLPSCTDCFEKHQFTLYARMLRLADYKSCCIAKNRGGKEKWGWKGIPSLLPLDRSNKNPENCNWDELDLSQGSSRRGTHCLGGAEVFLPVSHDTRQGQIIHERFPFKVSFQSYLSVNVLPDKTMAVTGLYLLARKTQKFGSEERTTFCKNDRYDMSYHGVTLNHILSNLAELAK